MAGSSSGSSGSSSSSSSSRDTDSGSRASLGPRGVPSSMEVRSRSGEESRALRIPEYHHRWRYDLAPVRRVELSGSRSSGSPSGSGVLRGGRALTALRFCHRRR
eukprot:4963936-Pyramimonas_sp.AAC.1